MSPLTRLDEISLTITSELNSSWAILLVLALLSVYAWTLIIGQWRALREPPEKKSGHQIAGTLSLCQKVQLWVGEEPQPNRSFFASQVSPRLAAAALSLRSSSESLQTLASVAPLLGLLGTVFGMLECFGNLSVTTQPAPQIFVSAPSSTTTLAVGIRSALITTQAGLVVALPIWLCNSWLKSRAEIQIQNAYNLAKQLESKYNRRKEFHV